MAKVDQDHAEWRQTTTGMDEEDLEDFPFPEYDSTIKSLEILKDAGITYNIKKEKWNIDAGY